MQQNKNMMIFAFASIVIFLSWFFIQNHFWPPKKGPDKADKKPELEAKKEVKEDKEPKKDKEKAEPPIDPRYLPFLAAVRAAFDPASAADPWRLTAIFAESQKWLPRATPPAQVPDIVVLGGLKDSKHHMEVKLTARGAGVQRLVLNKFRAANYLGRPVPDQDLELIGDDPFLPSYLMYLYNDFDDDARPIDTLGRVNWTLDNKSALVFDADKKVYRSPEGTLEQEARFYIDVSPQLRITKIYTLSPGAYHIEMALQITDKRTDGDPVKLRYQLSGAHGMPIEGEWFVTTPRTSVIGTVNASKHLYREQEDSYRISWLGGGTRVPADNVDLAPESFVQYAGVMTQFFCSLIVVDSKQKPLKTSADPRRMLAWARATVETTEMVGRISSLEDHSLVLEYMAGPKLVRLKDFELLPRVRQHIKDTGIKKNDIICLSYYDLPAEPSHPPRKVATWIRPSQTPRSALDDVTVRTISQVLQVKPGEKLEHKYLLYNGPSKVKQLFQFSGDDGVPEELVKKYNDTLHLSTVTDYGRFWFWSDLIIACSNVMHFLLFHLRFLGDGVSIVLLTVLVRGLMFPISRKQAIYSVKMQELAPEMKKLAEKFKDDPKARTEAIMELYRKYNVHPLGGCLPILLQMPIFIGLYFALQESVHFRLAKFLWIQNLAAPDMLFPWSESIPLISDPNGQGGVVMDRGVFQWLATLPRFLYLGPYFNLLPVIAVTFMIVQQKVMTPPPQDEQQAAQFKMMRYMMVVVGVMFYKVAAGLCMYIIISTVWGLTERRFLPKRQTALTPPAPTPPPGRTGASGRKQPVSKVPVKKPGGMQKVKDWWQEVLKQAKKK